MSWAFGRQTPDNNLMRFVARRFPHPVTMLDIGSGEGANARELREPPPYGRGHQVITVDKDPNVICNHPCDIRDFNPTWREGVPYDLVYDINTLCHVENPPFEKIKSWLKPTGIFFSICPSDFTFKGVAKGKEFTRFLTEFEARQFYGAYFKVTIGDTHYQLPHDELYQSWIIEACP